MGFHVMCSRFHSVTSTVMPLKNFRPKNIRCVSLKRRPDDTFFESEEVVDHAGMMSQSMEYANTVLVWSFGACLPVFRDEQTPSDIAVLEIKSGLSRGTT